jgi:hypothetical protein
LEIKDVLIDLDKMLKKQHSLFREQQKKELSSIDLSLFDLHDLIGSVINTVDCIIGLDSYNRFKSHLGIIFNLEKHATDYYESDRIKAVSYVMEHVENIVINDDHFSYIFNEQQSVFREKDRIKALANKGTDFQLISKETEKKVFEAYFKIFHFQTQYFFQLISFSECLLSSLPFIFFIHETKGTYAYYENKLLFISHLLTALTNASRNNTEAINRFKRASYTWFQQQNYFSQNDNWDLESLESYSFLLTKNQINEQIEVIKKEFLCEYLVIKEKNQNTTEVDSFLRTDIGKLKKSFEHLQAFIEKQKSSA